MSNTPQENISQEYEKREVYYNTEENVFNNGKLCNTLLPIFSDLEKNYYSEDDVYEYTNEREIGY